LSIDGDANIGTFLRRAVTPLRYGVNVVSLGPQGFALPATPVSLIILNLGQPGKTSWVGQ
jgi:hypothetical protein